jgi:hypothetical protein
MIYVEDVKKKKLYDGLIDHFQTIPPWIVLRTVELASTPGKAFDALYDFKLKMLPIEWDFEFEKWKKTNIEIT